MSLILPARSLLKPDRSIVTPGSPGWDDMPPDRPRRHQRATWWQRLLSGRAATTRLSPGTCCGCSGGGNIICGDCSIPASLSVSETISGVTLFSGISATYTTNIATVVPHWVGFGPGWVAAYTTSLAETCPECDSCNAPCDCDTAFTLYTVITCFGEGGIGLNQYALLNTEGCLTDEGIQIINLQGASSCPGPVIIECTPSVSILTYIGGNASFSYSCNSCVHGTVAYCATITVTS